MTLQYSSNAILSKESLYFDRRKWFQSNSMCIMTKIVVRIHPFMDCVLYESHSVADIIRAIESKRITACIDLILWQRGVISSPEVKFPNTGVQHKKNPSLCLGRTLIQRQQWYHYIKADFMETLSFLHLEGCICLFVILNCNKAYIWFCSCEKNSRHCANVTPLKDLRSLFKVLFQNFLWLYVKGWKPKVTLKGFCPAPMSYVPRGDT